MLSVTGDPSAQGIRSRDVLVKGQPGRPVPLVTRLSSPLTQLIRATLMRWKPDAFSSPYVTKENAGDDSGHEFLTSLWTWTVSSPAGRT
ncbi:hypothetical protein RRG08_009527 [Elysia crispata]|uniref:Uncharacterized protein n=1 Tax=Elysia crispata TaxID=231223 RepID=A0AAE1B2Y4_9GAST|nr:hypothetical protein RRG08_009527 [Elysia crispata]